MSYDEYLDFKKKTHEDDLTQYNAKRTEKKRLMESAEQKLNWSVKAKTKEMQLRDQGTSDTGIKSKISKLMKSQGALAGEAKRIKTRANN